MIAFQKENDNEDEDLGDAITQNKRDKKTNLREYERNYKQIDQFSAYELVDLSRVKEDMLNLGNNLSEQFTKDFFVRKLDILKNYIERQPKKHKFFDRKFGTEYTLEDTHRIFDDRITNLLLDEGSAKAQKNLMLTHIKLLSQNERPITRESKRVEEGSILPKKFKVFEMLP